MEKPQRAVISMDGYHTSLFLDVLGELRKRKIKRLADKYDPEKQ